MKAPREAKLAFVFIFSILKTNQDNGEKQYYCSSGNSV